MKDSTLAIVWRILDRSKRRRLLILPVLVLAGGLLEGLGVALVLPLLQVAASPDYALQSSFIAQLQYISGDLSGVPDLMLLLAAAVLAAFVLKNAFSLFLTYYQYNFVWQGRAVTAETLLRHYLNAPYVFHLQHNSATLLRNIVQTVQEVFAGTILPIVILAAEAVVVVVICALLLAVDPGMTATVFIALCVTTGFYYMFLRRPLKRWGATVQHTNKALIQHVQQSLGSIREIKIAGREPYFTSLFARDMLINSGARLRYQLASQGSRHLVEIVAVGMMAALLVSAVLGGRPVTETIPTLGVLAAAAYRLMPSVNRIATQLQNLQFNAAALKILYDDIRQARTGAPVPARSAPATPLPFEHKIALEDVSFRYPNSASDDLSEISLIIKRGESVAFVGASGAGKTTLAAVIMGLLAPTRGRIIVDGVPLSEAAVMSWQRHIGFIPQEVAILDDTLRQNVAFGVPLAELDERRLERAIRDAALDAVVAALPHGDNTILGERGTRLSGGERQRIGIARALYLDADVLVLDEATSALDAKTESEVSAAIRNLHGAKTLIIIAHRLSTIQNCERIYFVDGGEIADSGTFEELMRRNPSFKSMTDKMSLRHAR